MSNSHLFFPRLPSVWLVWGQLSPGVPVVYHEEVKTGREPPPLPPRPPTSRRNHLLARGRQEREREKKKATYHIISHTWQRSAIRAQRSHSPASFKGARKTKATPERHIWKERQTLRFVLLSRSARRRCFRGRKRSRQVFVLQAFWQQI